MFRHKTTAVSIANKKEEKVEKPIELKEVAIVEKPAVESEATIKELLEKNLKWSQIIYEQNRKINSKLLWTTIANWIKIFLIVVPLILAGILLVPMAKNIYSLYSNFLTSGNPATQSTNSLEQIIKLLPLNSAQQEQVKAILK